jgi:nucleotide-binding universal stress UspA family protein
MIALKHVLVPVDFSNCSIAAVTQARAFADRFDATLHVMHVVTQPLHEVWASYAPGADFLDTVQQLEGEACKEIGRLSALADIQPRRLVVATVWGDASEQILKYAASHRIDLIVCGTHGRHGWDRVIMGSVAERLVRLAPCPVLTVHAFGQEVAAA